MQIVLATGGFDPLHSGHIDYLEHAATLGDKLVVGLNSDDWLTRKKGGFFMTFDERARVLRSMKCVDEVFGFDDSNETATAAIFDLLSRTSHRDRIVFANGGDRTPNQTPEETVYSDGMRVKFKYGIGGGKTNSSSELLANWKNPKTDRGWGYYHVLHQIDQHVKVKELTVDPGKSLSMQKHAKRSELWFVAEGTATLTIMNGNTKDFGEYNLIQIPAHEWHQLSNRTDKPLRVVEIQFGEECVENDIIRK